MQSPWGSAQGLFAWPAVAAGIAQERHVPAARGRGALIVLCIAGVYNEM